MAKRRGRWGHGIEKAVQTSSVVGGGSVTGLGAKMEHDGEAGNGDIVDMLEMELVVVDEVDASAREGTGGHGGRAPAQRGHGGWRRGGEAHPRGHGIGRWRGCH